MRHEETPAWLEFTIVSEIKLFIERIIVLGSHERTGPSLTVFRHCSHPLHERLWISLQLFLKVHHSWSNRILLFSRWSCITHHTHRTQWIGRGTSASHSHHHLLRWDVVNVFLFDIDLEMATLLLLHLVIHLLHLLSLFWRQSGKHCGVEKWTTHLWWWFLYIVIEI